jgi:hypothetical protein
MFILRDLLSSLQQQFSKTKQGRKRAISFSYTLLAVIVPFTSNLLRSLNTLFRFSISMQRFYTYMNLGFISPPAELVVYSLLIIFQLQERYHVHVI